MQGLRIAIIGVLILMALVLVLRPQLASLGAAQPAMTLPLDLKELIPSNWAVLPGKYQHCDFDGDGEAEWLVIYRYDQTTVNVPSVQTNKTVSRGAIGGAIFKARTNQVPQEPGNTSPYRPAFLFPYRLLPDIYPGKGQGYLGDSDVSLSFSPPITRGTGCSVDEIAVFGYSDSQLPTRLSLFRWDRNGEGYLDRHFVGNARITTQTGPPPLQLIREVDTYDLFNNRSRLCERRAYVRQGQDEDLDFQENPAEYTIAFCYEAPVDPAYPEAVVVALLRGDNPDPTGTNPTPTGNSYLTTEAISALPAELSPLKNAERSPYRILALINPGTLESFPGNGEVRTESDGKAWLWGQERVKITTRIMLDGQQRDVEWHLVSLANELVQADTHWRIEDVKLR